MFQKLSIAFYHLIATVIILASGTVFVVHQCMDCGIGINVMSTHHCKHTQTKASCEETPVAASNHSCCKPDKAPNYSEAKIQSTDCCTNLIILIQLPDFVFAKYKIQIPRLLHFQNVYFNFLFDKNTFCQSTNLSFFVPPPPLPTGSRQSLLGVFII